MAGGAGLVQQTIQLLYKEYSTAAPADNTSAGQHCMKH
jgi:hypothetical protein